MAVLPSLSGQEVMRIFKGFGWNVARGCPKFSHFNSPQATRGGQLGIFTPLYFTVARKPSPDTHKFMGVPNSVTLIAATQTVIASSAYHDKHAGFQYGPRGPGIRSNKASVVQTRAGKVSVTTDKWIVSQGLSRIPYPLRDDLGCLRIFLCNVSLRFDQIC